MEVRAKTTPANAGQNGVYPFQVVPPRAATSGDEPKGSEGELGPAALSLRDWFAGQALVGVLAKLTHEEYLGASHIEIVDDAYRLADAMLARRSSLEP